jgi:hypothetical protein
MTRHVVLHQRYKHADVELLGIFLKFVKIFFCYVLFVFDFEHTIYTIIFYHEVAVMTSFALVDYVMIFENTF